MIKPVPATPDGYADELLRQVLDSNELQARGELTAARAVLEDALAKSREHLGEAHERTAGIVLNLSALLHMLGDPGASLALYEDHLALLRQTVGDDHPQTLIAEHNVAVVTRRNGASPAQVRAMFAASLEHRLRVLGDRHPLTASARHFVDRAA